MSAFRTLQAESVRTSAFQSAAADPILSVVRFAPRVVRFPHAAAPPHSLNSLIPRVCSIGPRAALGRMRPSEGAKEFEMKTKIIRAAILFGMSSAYFLQGQPPPPPPPGPQAHPARRREHDQRHNFPIQLWSRRQARRVRSRAEYIGLPAT